LTILVRTSVRYPSEAIKDNAMTEADRAVADKYKSAAIRAGKQR
jgi:hypothetical protein